MQMADDEAKRKLHGCACAISVFTNIHGNNVNNAALQPHEDGAKLIVIMSLPRTIVQQRLRQPHDGCPYYRIHLEDYTTKGRGNRTSSDACSLPDCGTDGSKYDPGPDQV